MNRPLWLALLALGCGRELLGADPEPASDPAVRAVIEAPEAPAAPSDVDAQGRLRAAEGLVQGFEVPVGLSLLGQHQGYLEFRIGAPIEALMEFWSGLDRRTGNRFTERRYLTEVAESGFDVRHTQETVRRLGLEERALDGYLYAFPDGHRGAKVRVHVPHSAHSGGDEAFMPHVGGPGAPSTPQGDGPSRRDPGEPGRGTPMVPTPEGGPSPLTQLGAGGGSPASRGNPQAGAKQRYGPYPNPGRSVVPDVRRWQAAHPNERFLD